MLSSRAQESGVERASRWQDAVRVSRPVRGRHGVHDPSCHSGRDHDHVGHERNHGPRVAVA
eukprot:148808-Pleurochrysis_carterae.AAC.1